MIKTKTATKKPAAAGAKKDNGKAAPAEKKSQKIELDLFGTRLGTQAAVINQCFSKTPRTTAEIAEKAKLPQPRVRMHIRWALARGFVKETKEGVVLK